jgi:HK97 family phage portal protein
MEIWNKIRGAFKNDAQTYKMSDIIELFSGKTGTYTADISEVTYFTCMKVLSESIGKMPVYLMDSDKNRVTHDTMYALGIAPNSIMTPVQFFTTLEYHRNHFGNGYALVEREKGKVKGLHILNPRRMQVWVNNLDEFPIWRYYYKYDANGHEYFIHPEDILHVRSWITEDTGLVGKSVREILADSMAGNKESQTYLNDLYKNGMTASAVVKFIGDLNEAKRNKVIDVIERQIASSKTKMFTIPLGWDVQPLNMKLADSQFYELKKYNALQIAAAFGLSPDHLNDYTKSSYNNSAMQNLQFYVNTLLYNITIYEQEMNRKLLTRREQDEGLGYKFNVWTILRGDPQQQADVLQKMAQSAIYSVNEARNKLDLPPCENGDVHMVNGSYVKLEEIGKAYAVKGSDNNVENQEQE